MLRSSIARPPRLAFVYRRLMSSSQPISDKERTKPKSSDSTSLRTTVLSSCLADTLLPGMNYLKGQPPVVSQPDDAYPAWLWTVLTPKQYEDDGPGGKKERVQRRQANRQAIKDRNFMQTQ